MTGDPPAYDAVVLAGGAGMRMGGVDKVSLAVGGQPLLDRVLCAVSDAERVVVVGPLRPTVRSVLWAREDPPGAGPVAALAAGLAYVRAPTVALLAGDLPFVTADLLATLATLRLAAGGMDGALLVDPDGRDQLLIGLWRTAALRAALPAHPDGAALRAVLGPLRAHRVPADALTCLDCDTEDDLQRARDHASGPA
jgi:molybdenum cofactor guanylyltransferase